MCIVIVIIVITYYSVLKIRSRSPVLLLRLRKPTLWNCQGVEQSGASAMFPNGDTLFVLLARQVPVHQRATATNSFPVVESG